MSIKGVIRYLQGNQIILALVLVIVGLVIVALRYVIFVLFFAFTLFTSILPIVNFFRKLLPSFFAIVVTYVILLSLFGLIIAAILPFFVSQLQQFFVHFSHYAHEGEQTLHLSIDETRITNFLNSQIVTIGRNTIVVTSNVVSIFFSSITVIIISFYLLYDYERMKKNILASFHASAKAKISEVLLQLEEKLGGWVRGQIILCFIVGVATLVGYVSIQLPFAVPLGIVAGILEIIPTVGPFLGVIPAILVAVTISPFKVLLVLLVYTIIQIIESNFLVTSILKKTTSLHPIIIICAIIIGNDLLGIPGALLAVPFTAFTMIILSAIFKEGY